jgi:hypothetical protein
MRLATVALVLLSLGQLIAVDAEILPAIHLDRSDPRSKIASFIRPYLDLPVGPQGLDRRLIKGLVRASKPDQLRVRLDVPVTPATLAAIGATGATVVFTSERWNDVVVEATLAQIDALARIPDIHQIAAVRRPRLRVAPSYASQADPVIHTDTIRSTFNVTGAGQKIGVISDSINSTTTVGPGTVVGSNPGILTNTTIQAHGDLPQSIQVFNLNYILPTDNPTDEGEALMEVAYHIAPGALYAFAPAGDSDTQFAASITALQGAGCTLICDDVGFTDEPMFQDGPVAQAAMAFHAAGGIFCSAAGNSANTGILTTFVNTGSGNLNNWGVSGSSTPGLLHLVLDPGVSVSITMEWNQPYHSYNLGSGATSDFDLYLYGSASTGGGNNILASSVDTNAGSNTQVGYDGVSGGPGDPVEILQYSNPSLTNPQDAWLAVNYVSGPQSNVVLRIVIDTEYGNVTSPAPNILVAGTSYGHPTAIGVLGIAAVPVQFPSTVESFTSLGGWGSTGVPYYFTTSGAAINGGAAQLRNKPDLAAPDGLYVYDSDFDFSGPAPSTANGFFGTSCATPAATAAAALAWCVQPKLTNQQITNELIASATAVSSPITPTTTSPDGWSGNGLVSAFTSIGKSYTSIYNITSPASGVLQSGTVSITVQFTNPVTVTGSPVLQLNTTPAETAVYTIGSGTNTLTFTYTIVPGDIANVLDVTGLSGGSITSVNTLPIVLGVPEMPGIGALGVNKTIQIAAGPFATTVVGVPATSNQTAFTFTITFAEAALASPASGITVSSNATLGTLTGSGTTWRQPVTLTTTGTNQTITVSVAANTVTDSFGIKNLAGSGSVTYDIVPPTVVITPQPSPVVTNSALTVTFTFDKPVTGFTSSSVSVTGGAIAGSMMGSGAVYSLPMTSGGVGTMTITVNALAATDLAGNVLADPTSVEVAVVNPPSSNSSKCGLGAVFGFMMLGGLFWLRRGQRGLAL